MEREVGGEGEGEVEVEGEGEGDVDGRSASATATPTSSTRTTGRNASGGMSRTRAAPHKAPAKPAGNVTRARFASSRPACAYRSVDANVPKTPCALLVPSARWGGRPAASSAGRALTPLPPATPPTMPAARAARGSPAIAPAG